MRLLLDERYSPQIARRLRERGHDVISVSEQKHLRGLSDSELMHRMSNERRAILTNNVHDYVPLASSLVAAGQGHAGLILTSDRSLPRRRNTIGRFVRVLNQFLSQEPRVDALRNRIRWLPQSGIER